MAFNIGTNVFNEKSVFLAPMEDVTDAVFRKLCREFGADMVFTEFVSSDALIRNVNRTMDKLSIFEGERPVAIQIYGKNPKDMAEAARIAERVSPEVIDINFGCPVRKIATKGAGAGLLKNIPLMVEITREVVNAVSLPVTVKTRLGWDDNTKQIKEIALLLQDAGIKAITVHGRTRQQMYSGNADWTLIKELKEMPEIKIPVIGNGDIDTPEKAANAFSNFGVDAIMIGRASIGAPWFFREVKDHLLKQSSPPLSASEKMDVLRILLEENCLKSGEMRGILHTRRHLAATPLFKGLENFRPLRIQMLRSESVKEIFGVFENIRKSYFC